MEPIEFDGSMDLDEAYEWIHSIQNILEFMELKDKDKVWCASSLLKRNAQYWWKTVCEWIDVSFIT